MYKIGNTDEKMPRRKPEAGTKGSSQLTKGMEMVKGSGDSGKQKFIKSTYFT